MTNNHSEYAPLGTYTSERSESRTATEQSSLIEASKGELEDRDETQSEQSNTRKLEGKMCEKYVS